MWWVRLMVIRAYAFDSGRVGSTVPFSWISLLHRGFSLLLVLIKMLVLHQNNVNSNFLICVLSDFFNQICVSLSFIDILLLILFLFLKKPIVWIKLNRLILRRLRINRLESFHYNVTLRIPLLIRVRISELCRSLQIKFNMVPIHQDVPLTSLVRLTMLYSRPVSRPFLPFPSFWLALRLCKIPILHFKYADRRLFNPTLSFERLGGRWIIWNILPLLFGLLWVKFQLLKVLIWRSSQVLDIRSWLRAMQLQRGFFIRVIRAHFIFESRLDWHPVLNLF